MEITWQQRSYPVTITSSSEWQITPIPSEVFSIIPPSGISGEIAQITVMENELGSVREFDVYFALKSNTNIRDKIRFRQGTLSELP